MTSWRAVAVGAVLSGSFWAAACGSDAAKKAIRDDAGGAGGAEAAAGGSATTPRAGDGSGAASTDAGATGTDGGTPGVGGSVGNGGAPLGNGGTPFGNGGTPLGNAGDGPGPATPLTSCDAPLVIDDAAPASIAPDQATIFQGAGGPTLITWREGNQRKGRVLKAGNTIGKVVTFPEANAGSEYFPHFAVSGSGGLVYTTPNTPTTSLSIYNATSDSWAPEDHAGLWFDLVQFLAHGDTLHVVTDAVGSTGSLQVRSKAGVWGSAVPVFNLAPDRIILHQLLLDDQERGALIVATGPDSPSLKGYAIRGGVVVAEASLPIDVNADFTAVAFALEPNGDVLGIFQHTGDTVTRAVSFSYDESADSATFSNPIELEPAPAGVHGVSVNARGDAAMSYDSAGSDWLRRRIDGVWSPATKAGVSDGWFADPLFDADGTAYVARSLNESNDLEIVSSAAGSSQWSAPLDVKGNFGWKFPQRPRLGLHESGHPMVVWTGSNSSGGRDILLSVCR